jgi:hypothetical protein
VSGSWSGLGFDPAPGNMGSAQALVDQLGTTSRYLKETHDVLESVKNQQSVWSGDASKKFGEKLDKLPGYLNDAQTSLSKASGLLAEWKGQLEGFQKTARDLEDRAKVARGQAASAAQAYQSARAHPDLNLGGATFSDQAALQAAQQRYATARAALDNASNQAGTAHDLLDDLVAQAKNLQDRHKTEAERIADAIENAGEDYSPDEGFFEAIGNWLERNAELLGQIADIAGVISAIAGVLAFIPVLAPIMGPIAIATGAIALLGHSAAMVGKGEYGLDEWVGVGADVLGVIPGVGAVKAGIEAGTDAVSIGAKVAAGAQGVGKVMSEAAALPKMAAEAMLGGTGRAAREMAENLAKGMQASVNLTAHVPTMIEWVTPGETEKDRKAGFGWLAGVGNLLQAF